MQSILSERKDKKLIKVSLENFCYLYPNFYTFIEDEKSMERRLEALEKDAHKRNKQHKNKHGRKYRQAEDEFEDINETMKEYNYETKNSKLNSR